MYCPKRFKNVQATVEKAIKETNNAKDPSLHFPIVQPSLPSAKIGNPLPTTRKSESGNDR